jgi:TP901 family phage tail tape measure protein
LATDKIQVQIEIIRKNFDAIKEMESLVKGMVKTFGTAMPNTWQRQFQDLSAQLDNLRKRLSGVTGEWKNPKEETIVRLATDLKSVEKQLVSTTQSFKEFQRVVAMTGSLNSKVIQPPPAGVLSEAEKAALGQAAATRFPGMTAGQMVAGIKEEVAQAKNLANGTKEATDSMGKQWTIFGRTFDDMGQGFIKSMKGMMIQQAEWYAGKALLFGTAGAIVGGVKEGISVWANWTQNLKNVQAVSELTTKDMTDMEKVSRQIGITTPTSAKEASAAMLEFAQAGLKANEIMTMTPLAAKMVVATGEDMKVSVTALTTVFNAFKLSAADMPKVADTIAASMAASALKVSDLSTVFNYAASTAHGLKVSFDDLMVLTTALSKVGVKPSTIGTGLSQVLTNLERMAPKLEKQIKAIGLKPEDFQVTKVEPGNVIKLFESLANSPEGAMSTKGIFAGVEMRTGRALLALRDFADQLRKLKEEVTKPGILEKMFGTSMEGPINQWKLLKNVVEDTFITMGQASKGALTGAIKMLNDMALGVNAAFGGEAISQISSFNETAKGTYEVVSSIITAFKLLGDILSLPLGGLGLLMGQLTEFKGVLTFLIDLMIVKFVVSMVKGMGIMTAFDGILGRLTGSSVATAASLEANALAMGGMATKGAGLISFFTKLIGPIGLVILAMTTILDLISKIRAEDAAMKASVANQGTVIKDLSASTIKRRINMLEQLKKDIAQDKKDKHEEQVANIESGQEFKIPEKSGAIEARAKSFGFVGVPTDTDIDESIKKHNEKLAALDKEEKAKPKKEAPPADKTTKEAFDSYRSRVALLKAEAKEKLDIAKANMQSELVALDEQQKFELLTIEEYTNKKIAIEEKGHTIRKTEFENEKAALKEEKEKEIEELNKKADKDHQYVEKKKAIDNKYLTDLANIRAREYTEEAKFEDDKVKLYGDSILKRRQLEAEAHQKRMEIAAIEAQRARDTEAWGASEKVKQAQWAYGKNRVSSDEYYKAEEAAIAKDLENIKAGSAEKANLARNTEAMRTLKEQAFGAGDYIQNEDAARKYWAELEKIAAEARSTDIKGEQDAASKRTEIQRQQSDNIKKIYSDQGEVGVIKKAMLDLGEELSNYGQRCYETMKSLANNMQTAMGDIFFDAMEGKLKSAADYWKAFASSVYRVLSDYLAKEVMAYITASAKIKAANAANSLSGAGGGSGGGIGGLFGIFGKLFSGGGGSPGVNDMTSGWGFGGIDPTVAALSNFHKGGEVVPRLHLGLDEVPAILQTKERVLSRPENSVFNNLMKMSNNMNTSKVAAPPMVVQFNVSAVDAASFEQYLLKNKGSVSKALRSAMSYNDPMRRNG